MSRDALTEIDWSVRADVYATFAESGRAPGIAQIASERGIGEGEARAALVRLSEAHQLALHLDGTVWMAHPFSAVPTDYPVETPTTTCWANCAWDALGIPAIVGSDGWTRTACAQSGVPLEFGVRGGALAGDDCVVHLLTPLRDAWVDIGFT